MTPKVRKLIANRDTHCWHCGSTDDLVVHHRKNRGSGGSKNPDINKPQNLILVCWRWNSDMESHYQAAQASRLWGHKIPSWAEFDTPVFDMYAHHWYVLHEDGSKRRVETDEGRAVRLLLPDLF